MMEADRSALGPAAEYSSYVPLDLHEALIAALVDSRAGFDGELLDEGALDRRSLEGVIRARFGSRAIR